MCCVVVLLCVLNVVLSLSLCCLIVVVGVVVSIVVVLLIGIGFAVVVVAIGVSPSFLMMDLPSPNMCDTLCCQFHLLWLVAVA